MTSALATRPGRTTSDMELLAKDQLTLGFELDERGSFRANVEDASR